MNNALNCKVYSTILGLSDTFISCLSSESINNIVRTATTK